MPTIQLRRVYDPKRAGEVATFLVERLWPRGVKKEALGKTPWLRDVGPSTELRKWFSHDPSRWETFRHRYAGELDANPEAWRPILEAARHGPVTLLFSSRDVEHNNAVALKAYLERKLSHHAHAEPPAHAP